MNIMIPLGLGSNWGNNELRYFLRSLEENFQEDFNITILANEIPKWIKPEYAKVIPRFYPQKAEKLYNGSKKYENFFDVLNKVRTYANENEFEFIYAYDDDLLINKITSSDIKNEPLEPEESNYCKIREQQQKHLLTINQSFILYKKICDPINFHRKLFVCETHLPRIYNCSHLRWLFNIFSLEDLEIPFALATLYFNIFPEQSGTIPISESNTIQARFSFEDGVGCYDSNTLMAIEEATKGKTWVNYNDKALFNKDAFGNCTLMNWIEKKFQNKSKFEV